jgi:hypothetical protein
MGGAERQYFDYLHLLVTAKHAYISFHLWHV